MTDQEFLAHFPYRSANSGTIYFDSAATTQKPAAVIKAVSDYLAAHCANPDRSTHYWASQAQERKEQVRRKVAAFLGATPAEIVFTSGATESINTLAYGWALHTLRDGDEILFSPGDHQSNVLPWARIQELLAWRGVRVSLVPYKSFPHSGDADLDDLLAKITERTRLISLTHIHNVFGLQSEVSRLKGKLPERAMVSLDATQSVGHIPVKVDELGADFLSFSGHKIFALEGIGVLYARKRTHGQFLPFQTGGGIALPNGKLKNFPYFLEAGTPNTVGIISLGAAIDFIDQIGTERIRSKLLRLTQRLLKRLREIPQIEFLPGAANAACVTGYGIVSFRIPGISSEDVGFILNERKIYVRTGAHCSADRNSTDNSVRVSMHIYNTEEEIDRLAEVIREIADNLQR